MKRIYESFEEIADTFTDGESWSHRLSDHVPDDCCAWQHGVAEFAKFLDSVGLKIVSNPEIYDTLWDCFRNYKPKIFKKCKKKKAKRRLQ